MTLWLYNCVPARPHIQQISIIASFQNVRLMGRLWSGPRLVSQIWSGVWVSDSIHILSCAVVYAVVRSGFRGTHAICRSWVCRKHTTAHNSITASLWDLPKHDRTGGTAEWPFWHRGRQTGRQKHDGTDRHSNSSETLKTGTNPYSWHYPTHKVGNK